ncbi:MAG: sigma-70 family RNA polymerase sigma factor [Phycisphaerales bacterium]|nr:MAG: sigma-70 family RNA polymerase sigma factor [Phycisphaerales bacterium]
MENPLQSEVPRTWDDLVEALQPASMLLVIERRMSVALRQRIEPEDIWQETLLQAWRDRRQCEWRGLKSFRSWLLSIADHRIRDAAVYHDARKRGGGRAQVALAGGGADESNGSAWAGPVASTTPSRVALQKEQAAAMRAALEALPDGLREVVWMRLFEQLPIDEVAARLEIGPSAVRHRFRKGAELYQERLRAEWATQSRTLAESAPADGAFSAPVP